MWIGRVGLMGLGGLLVATGFAFSMDDKQWEALRTADAACFRQSEWSHSGITYPPGLERCREIRTLFDAEQARRKALDLREDANDVSNYYDMYPEGGKLGMRKGLGR